MAKVSKKVEAVAEATGVASSSSAPAAYIEPHGGGERVHAVAPNLVRDAMRAWGLARRIEELEAEFKQVKEALAEDLGTGESLVVTGVCRVSVASSTTVSVTDVDELRALLGERFDDLVTETVSYKPSEQLIEMSADGDDPMAPAYRAVLKIRQSRVVRITAQK